MIKLLRGRERPRALRSGLRRFSRRWKPRPTPEITQNSVSLRGLPDAFHGFRVAQLTDIHHGIYTPLAMVERAVEETNRLGPDVVVLTGDFVTFSSDYVNPVAAALGKLRARLGIFAVLGNHDYHAGADLVARELRRQGIDVLRNSHTAFRSGRQRLWLAGVDDLWHNCDLRGATRGIPRDGLKVLLSHNPGIIRQAAGYGFDLVLSGHTHGGQIRLPVLGSLYLYRTNRFSMGWDRLHDTQIYVSRGLGKSLLPFRIGCPPEIAMFEFRAA